jgi:iron complex outermembrane recepter protein
MKSILFASFLLFGAKAQSQINDTLNSKKIDSITVISKKPMIEVMVDKTVLNVDNMPSTTGQNALDVLRSAPGVVVDGNDNIKMNGSAGVTILIDGKNTNMSAQDIANLLKTIEASNIKDIELITNPSAKYDAAGNAGIINIKLKKSITNGVNGNINTTYQQSVHARKGVSGSFNVRKNKLNWFSTVSVKDNEQNTIADNERTSLQKQYTQKSIENDKFSSSLIRSGLDYNINKKNTIGILWMANNYKSTMDNNSQTMVNQTNATDTNIVTRSLAPFVTNRNNFNVNYKYNNAKGEELNVDADYTNFISSLYNTVNNDAFTNTTTKYGSNSTQNNADVAIKILSAKLDYSLKINSKSQIEAGAKTVFTNTNNALVVLNASNNNWLQDTGKTNTFRYQENINAAYFNFNISLKKFTIQAGVRAEQTNILATSTNLKSETITNPDTSYINLFPTLFVQYSINNKHQIGINYGKRIDRPSYQDQNPFIYVLDAFNSEVGNPYLLPQISNSIEVSYSYKYATNAKLKYTQTSNYIEQLTFQSGTNTILTPQNAGSRKMITLSISTPLQPKPWWNIYVSAEPFWQQFNTTINGYGVNRTSNTNSIGFNGYISNSFTLKNKWRAELSGWFSYQNATTIYISKPLASLNIGISKNCMKDKATIKLGITDLLNTQRWEQSLTNTNLTMHTYRKWESRNISFSFTYRFGNSKIKAARDRSTGSEGENERIKEK